MSQSVEKFYGQLGGHKDAQSRLSQSEFKCTSCAHKSNADVNAAKNISSRGTALYRQGEAVACA